MLKVLSIPNSGHLQQLVKTYVDSQRPMHLDVLYVSFKSMDNREYPLIWIQEKYDRINNMETLINNFINVLSSLPKDISKELCREVYIEHQNRTGTVSIEGDSVALIMHALPITIFGYYCAAITLLECAHGIQHALKGRKTSKLTFNVLQSLFVSAEVVGMSLGLAGEKEASKGAGGMGLLGVGCISLARILYRWLVEGASYTKHNKLYLLSNLGLFGGCASAGVMTMSRNSDDEHSELKSPGINQLMPVSLILVSIFISLLDRYHHKESPLKIMFPFIKSCKHQEASFPSCKVLEDLKRVNKVLKSTFTHGNQNRSDTEPKKERPFFEEALY